MTHDRFPQAAALQSSSNLQPGPPPPYLHSDLLSHAASALALDLLPLAQFLYVSLGKWRELYAPPISNSFSVLFLMAPSGTRRCAKGSRGQLRRRWPVITMHRSSQPLQHCRPLLFFKAHLGDVSTLHSALFCLSHFSDLVTSCIAHIPAVEGFKLEWPTHLLSQSTCPFCSKPSNLPLLDHRPLSWTPTQRQ
jgi:hypothetical protein